MFVQENPAGFCLVSTVRLIRSCSYQCSWADQSGGKLLLPAECNGLDHARTVVSFYKSTFHWPQYWLAVKCFSFHNNSLSIRRPTKAGTIGPNFCDPSATFDPSALDVKAFG